MLESVKTVLVLAPHTDDGELGCGATIAKLIDRNADVYYLAFSICETSIPSHLPPDILATEVVSATRTLGIPRDNLMIKKYPVRQLQEYRQAILEELITLKRGLKPDVVFLPSSTDIHQDHQVVNNEGVRAFKHTTILGYELPWNNLNFSSTGLYILEERYIDQKLQAVQQYKSQSHRNYLDKNLLKSIARLRGQQANALYAEAFEVIRWIM